MALRLVDDDFVPADSDRHSVRVKVTPEHLSELEYLTRNVLTSADLAVAELRNAIINRDRDAAFAAGRRLLASGLLARDFIQQMEREA